MKDPAEIILDLCRGEVGVAWRITFLFAVATGSAVYVTGRVCFRFVRFLFRRIRDWKREAVKIAEHRMLPVVVVSIQLFAATAACAAMSQEYANGILRESEEMRWETASLCTVIALVVIAITTRIIYYEKCKIDGVTPEDGLLQRRFPWLFIISRSTIAAAGVGVVYELLHQAGTVPPHTVILLTVGVLGLACLYYLILYLSFRFTAR